MGRAFAAVTGRPPAGPLRGLVLLLAAGALTGCQMAAPGIEAAPVEDGLIPIPPSPTAMAALPDGASPADLMRTADDCWSLETGDAVAPLVGPQGARVCG